MTDYLVTREPQGETLRNLISIAAERCNTFLFVLEDMALSERGTEVVARLEPMLLSREETNEYPAGTLPWDTVTAYTYRVTPESVAIVCEATDRLFSWLQPDLPNDLCFLRNGRPWMTTMASDRELLLTLDEAEYRELRSRLRGLRLTALE